MNFLKKLLKIVRKLSIVIFILLILYFIINSHLRFHNGSSAYLVLAGICVVIVGYLYYMNKYRY